MANTSKNSRSKVNKKKREDLKIRKRITERKRLGLADGEEEALVAGPLRRYIAFTIDIMTYIAFWVFCLLASIPLTDSISVIGTILPISVLVFGCVYSIPKIKIEGKTFGRQKVNIEVINRDGSGFLSWPRAIARWFVEIGLCFSLIPAIALVYNEQTYTITFAGLLLLGAIAVPIFFTEHRQGLHDIAGNSVVVRVFPEKKKIFKK